jgi:hypothetical protein
LLLQHARKAEETLYVYMQDWKEYYAIDSKRGGSPACTSRRGS